MTEILSDKNSKGIRIGMSHSGGVMRIPLTADDDQQFVNAIDGEYSWAEVFDLYATVECLAARASHRAVDSIWITRLARLSFFLREKLAMANELEKQMERADAFNSIQIVRHGRTLVSEEFGFQ